MSGEITPEKANWVGYETAMRWTKDKYVFFVATHTDHQYIHNHIYYNSTLRIMEESGCAAKRGRGSAISFLMLRQ